MTELEKAAKQALKALCLTYTTVPTKHLDFGMLDEAITALTVALEQPAQQEPVAWYDEEMDSAYTESELGDGNTDGLEPLYTRFQAREPLTPERVNAMASEHGLEGDPDAQYWYVIGLIDGEAAHGITGEKK